MAEVPVPPPQRRPADEALAAELRRRGEAAGLVIGFTTAEILEPAATVIPLRKERGLAADLQFTYRRPERSTDPRWSFPAARSLVAAAMRYPTVGPAPTGATPARVGRYSWVDHYADLRAALNPLAERLRADGHRAEIHADDNHLVDRNVAWRAGLGWWGKNANLLTAEHGSWVVLGTILTDADLPPDAPRLDGCGPCRRCLDDCPTEAIVAPGVVDAGRCLSWLLQARGPIPAEFRVAVGDRVYGCDDCQEVCPPSARGGDDRLPADRPAQPWVDAERLLELDDATLLGEVGRWYLADRNPDVVRRSALVVLGNARPSPARRAVLERYARHPSPLLRAHALWAARRHGLAEYEPFVGLRLDPDPAVRAEWAVDVEPHPALDPREG